MNDETVITCKKCGKKHNMTADGKGQVIPIFCCGNELKKNKNNVTSRVTSATTISKKNKKTI